MLRKTTKKKNSDSKGLMGCQYIALNDKGGNKLFPIILMDKQRDKYKRIINHGKHSIFPIITNYLYLETKKKSQGTSTISDIIFYTEAQSFYITIFKLLFEFYFVGKKC